MKIVQFILEDNRGNHFYCDERMFITQSTATDVIAQEATAAWGNNDWVGIDIRDWDYNQYRSQNHPATYNRKWTRTKFNPGAKDHNPTLRAVLEAAE